MRDRWRGRPSTEEEPTDDAGDAELVVRARCDPGAYEELFRRYWNAVLRYCYYRLGTWEEAEDAAGDVFANAFAAHARFTVRNRDASGSFRSWLFWIAHNEVVSARRKRAHRTELSLDGLDSFADLAPSPEELAVATDAHDRAYALLQHLPEDQRRVCELRLAGLSGKEIAEVLNKSHDAVRSAQFRAEPRLRALLGTGAARTGASHG